MCSGYFIGLMSGTSLDGVDVSLCKISKNHFSCEGSYYLKMEQSLKDELLSMIEGETTLAQVGRVDHKLAIFFAEAVNAFLKQEKIEAKEIVAIGSHGQTLWHEPKGENPFSMQLGNASVLAVETGIDVVTDFRSKDIALGGEGAPFAPAFHNFLFSKIKKCAVLNIGGMANISILGENLIGYDTGCGNVLMDMWISEIRDLPYDRDGLWAKMGNIDEKLLENMLKDDYFNLNYPKSTGREYFNKVFLIKYIEPYRDTLSPEDIEATLLALTVHSIANEIKKFDIEELLVSGGGADNLYLMEMLQRELPNIKVSKTERYGISSDNMEAMIFAWLAYKRLNRESISLKSVTGAKNNTILGGVYARS